MTLPDTISVVVSRGWKPHPQAHQPPKPDDHFGTHDDYAAYFSRVGHTDTPTWEGAKSTHEYLLIISKDGVVLEMVYERYLAPKNTRRPKGRAVFKRNGDRVDQYSDHQYKGFVSIYATILRGEEGLERL